MNTKGYKEGINDAIEVLSQLYERYQRGDIYNKEIKEALEGLKRKYIEETTGPLFDIYMKLWEEHIEPVVIEKVMTIINTIAPKNHPVWMHTPTWKKIQFDVKGNPIIPENSIVRDGYYIDIISLDKLPKEENNYDRT